MPECRNCGKTIETGEYCPECADALASPFGSDVSEAPFSAAAPETPFAQSAAAVPQNAQTAAYQEPRKKTNPAGIIALLVLFLIFAGAAAYVVLAFSGILQ